MAAKPKRTKADKERSVSHHVDTLQQQHAHALRHVQEAAKGGPSAKFNAKQALGHLQEMAAPIKRMARDVNQVPGIKKETSALKKAKAKTHGGR